MQRTAALRCISLRLLKIQDEERRKIARDLHDRTSQILAGIMMSVAALQNQFEKDEAASHTLNEISGMANQALQEIRTTSYLLHPPLLDERGLASAARWYAEGFAKRSGIQLDLDFPSDAERLASDVEMVLSGSCKRASPTCIAILERRS
jgi:two-component system, NarL family, sensor kinase